MTPLDEVTKAEAEFEAAWKNSSHTRYELPRFDLNRALAPRPHGTAAPRFTGSMLWDAELRKAWDPATYIPSVVRSGHSWDRLRLPAGDEVFWRVSEQRSWMAGNFVSVIERVALDHRARRAIFLGRPEAPGKDGKRLAATIEQPLFFVEHSVQGTEDAPVIGFRIVHLTARPDERLIERLSGMLGSISVPEYVDIYRRRDLGADAGSALAAPESEYAEEEGSAGFGVGARLSGIQRTRRPA